VGKLRVLFHVTHLRRGGGIESSLMSWLRVLDRERYAIGLSIAYPNADLEEIYRARIPSDVAVHVLGAESWLSHCRNLKSTGNLGWAGLLYEEALLPQVRKRVFRARFKRLAQDYDVIIDYDLSLARFAWGFAQPLVGISHFSLAQRLSNNRRKYRKAADYFRRYDALVSICDAMREEGVRMFPFMAERFVTLYPGFDIADAQRRATAPMTTAVPPSFIVAVTRLEETQKDVTTLIEAYAALVHDHGIAESLLVIGEGRHRAQLEQLAARLGVGDRVVFAGFNANPMPYVRAARLLVLSSKFEGLPTVLIEGLMLGQVLVATDCPTGPMEILDGGNAGLLVPVGDQAALANAMLRALRDPALRERLQAGALAHAKVFGTEAFGERLRQLLQRLLPGAGRW
jgi:glycosyltransferase involved in cell wall biosynthesis